MNNEKIILSIRRPEIREHFYFKLTLTTFNISINHTQKELERAIEVLKSHDLLEFNRNIEKVKNKEQLKDILRASFEIWSGDKLEWLQYTKKKVKRPFGNSVIEDAGYKNLWNDWFNEMELKHKNDIELQAPQKHLSLRRIALKCIYENNHIRFGISQANEIALKYGHKSGAKLLTHYDKLKHDSIRVNPNDESIRIKKAIIKDMEIVLQYLEGSQAKEKCLKEINIIKESL
jgi:hypothetical protein